VVAVAFETIAVATAMPAAARDLDGLDLYAWAFSLFLIGQLFATVAGGRLCDRIGPARPMAGALVLFAVGLLVAATATSMVQLVLGRLVQGLASGVVGVAMYVVIAHVYHERQRPRMMSYVSSAWVLPSLVGPGVAAWLTEHLDWRAVFWAVLPLLAFGAVMMLPPLLRLADAPAAVPGPGVAEPAAGDQAAGPSVTATGRPAALWAAGMAAVGAAVVQLGGQRLSLGGVLLSLAGLVLVALSLPNLMPPGFFRFRPGLAPLIVVRTLVSGAFFGAEAFVPLMLVEQRGVSLLAAGSTLTVGAVGWSIGSWLQSWHRLQLSRSAVISLGAASVLVGVALMALVAWMQLWLGVVAVAWVFAGLGMGLAMAGTSLATMTLSDTTSQGRNASSLQFGDAFGGGLFVGVGGTVFAALRPTGDLTLSFASILAAMTLVALLAVLASLRVGSVGPARQDRPAATTRPTTT
jgi:MFS family permease